MNAASIELWRQENCEEQLRLKTACQRVKPSLVILAYKLFPCLVLMAEEPLAERIDDNAFAGRRSARVRNFHRLCLSWLPARRCLAGA